MKTWDLTHTRERVSITSNRVKFGVLIIVILLATFHPATAESKGVTIEVTGEGQTYVDSVVEQEIDLAIVAKELGHLGSVDPQAVRVMEVNASGEPLATMASQVDPADAKGKSVLCWQIPGELPVGETRRFRILFDSQSDVPRPLNPVTADQTDGITTTVSYGDVVLNYDKALGGMVRQVTVDGTSAQLTWGDKAFDGSAVYYLANHTCDKVRLLASGPLRVVYETSGQYLDDKGKKNPAKLRAVYRFSHYAGDPLVHLEAEVTQDFSQEWTSLHFSEIHFDGAPIDSYATDRDDGGPLVQSGETRSGGAWAAVYGPKLLLGVCNSSSPMVWDGGGRHYGAYLSAGATSQPSRWRCTFLWGRGPDDLPTLRRGSSVGAGSPMVRVRLESLEQRISELDINLDLQDRQRDNLNGQAWIADHVTAHVARGKLNAATHAMSSGDLERAMEVFTEALSLSQRAGASVEFRSEGTVISGKAGGYPFLANDTTAYIWAREQDGAGLISIYDRELKHEFLRVDATASSFWEISVKDSAGGKIFRNSDMPSHVTAVDGGLDFTWSGSRAVRVSARLKPEETLARLRLEANAQTSEEGLTMVVFPVIRSILPISVNASEDVVLDTWALGDIKQSPLVSGKSVQTDYPYGMQFSALLANAKGLYFAEEDPEANRKALV